MQTDDELVAALSSQDAWETDPPAPRRFVVDVLAFAERSREEERRAAALCDEVLQGPSAWWPQRMRASAAEYSAGLVRQLLDRVGPICDTESPAKALIVTTMAIEIADALSVVSYPCDYVIKLRAEAHRDHAYILSFLGRHPEALTFADRAKELFDQVPLPQYDLARLALVKAAILRSIDRAAEGAVLARDAAQTFLCYGDRTRYLNARVTEAALVYQTEAVAEALDIWLSLQHEPDLESVTRVRLLHNIGTSYARLDRPAEAIEFLQRAIAEYELLGMHAERTRSRWQLGQALVAAGKTRDALPLLRNAWREFDGFEMTADAALAALNLAEALLILGEPQEVPSICRDIVARFTQAGMTSRAMTALSFLREAVALGEATPSLVRHVYAFLRKLPDARASVATAPVPRQQP
jgi:tetratricopeptide (TPR) repeat protein